jgi:hypothetical protein
MKTANPTQKPARQRRLPDIDNSSSRLDEKLVAILDGGDPKTQIYVYRAQNDWPVPPYLFKCSPRPDLTHHIRTTCGIRCVSRIILSGTIEIDVPINC